MPQLHSPISRRNLFLTAGLGAISWAASRKTALAQIAITPTRESNEVLVFIFLRGGADGLNIVVPYGEDEYYKLRPTLAIPPPGHSRDGAIDLNRFFGLHPSLSSILPLYKGGDLSFVHACGSFDQTRSHFDAMSTMERGLPQASGKVSTGWLARHLNSSPHVRKSPLSAVAFGDVLPDSLRGALNATSLESLADYRLDVRDTTSQMAALDRMYEQGKDAVSLAGQETLKALRVLDSLDMGAMRGKAASYPNSDLGHGLRDVAVLIKAELGLEIACLDKDGWDTHVAQGSTTGWQASLLKDLGDSLAAFASDIGPRLKNVTVVAVTEFGRRAYENSGLGTDHGRASFMILLGGGTKGGQVLTKWPSLNKEALEGPGDLRVTTDYRNVLAEIVSRRLGNPNIDQVFPGLAFDAPSYTSS